MERPSAWKKYTPQQIEELEELCRGYKQFLSENKTERLCVKAGIKMAEVLRTAVKSASLP